jgi:hypothetical protein
MPLKSSFPLLASALFLAVSSPALAEDGDAEVKISAVKTWQFPKCTIARDKWLVEKLLASKQNSPEYKTMLAKLMEKNGSLAS